MNHALTDRLIIILYFWVSSHHVLLTHSFKILFLTYFKSLWSLCLIQIKSTIILFILNCLLFLFSSIFIIIDHMVIIIFFIMAVFLIDSRIVFIYRHYETFLFICFLLFYHYLYLSIYKCLSTTPLKLPI